MVEDRIYVSDPMPFRVIEVRKASTNRMSAITKIGEPFERNQISLKRWENGDQISF